MECLLIEQLLKDPKRRKEIPDVTEKQVEEAIISLASNKAPDHLGLNAEHFKKGRQTVISFTTKLLNAVKKDITSPMS